MGVQRSNRRIRSRFIHTGYSYVQWKKRKEPENESVSGMTYWINSPMKYVWTSAILLL